MMPSPLSRRVAPLICLALLAGPPPLQASQTIRCESPNMGYRHCRADTDDRVELVRQLSGTECRENRNWGHDRRGVWVNRGCGAEFRVGRGGSGSSDKAALGVALLGLAAIAAAASSQHKQAQDDIGTWAVGSFRGYDETEGTEVQLSIMPGGAVSGSAGGHGFSGSLDGNRLQAGRHSFRVSRSGNGFSAVDERDANHRVLFQRSSSGGGY